MTDKRIEAFLQDVASGDLDELAVLGTELVQLNAKP
jgi:hypothetical protein